MKRILVGVDGSESSADVLSWSVDLAHRTTAELEAARVFVPNQAEIPPAQYDDFHDRQRRELEQWCEAQPGKITTALLDGDPADALLSEARQRHADLLVVGGRGAGGFLHLHLGSVAHHLTHHTTVPLAIVQRSGTASVSHIVVGVDGSPGSSAAVDLTADLAAELGVSVTAVYAFEPFAEWVPETDPTSWHQLARAELVEWTAPIDKAGVPLEVVVDRDLHPVAAITRALDAHPGALACLGTSGLGGFSGMRLGRVPLQLVHHSSAAVMLTPSPR